MTPPAAPAEPRTEAAAGSRRAVFEVEGLCCASEVRQIERRLGSQPGVTALGFDLVGRRMTVDGEIPAAEVERAVAELGLKARLADRVPEQASWWQTRGRLMLVLVAGVLWAGSLAADHLLGLRWLAAVLAIGTIATGGRYIVPRGIRAALNRALDMNFLMSVAAVGALAIGEYGEAASAMFLFAVAQLLESRSMDRARNAIRGLMDLSPAQATVLRDGVEIRVPVEQVGVGETVIVRPGEKIPVDGEIRAGRSGVNQAPITGESLPVDKEPGDGVFAGTLNGDGALEVSSTRPASDSTLARIIHSVEEAQASRAPSQTFVERFARVYTPAVVFAALALALLPPLAGFGGWGEWFGRALVLLVVACPCALVISTPVTVVSALAGAARRGILIKGGLHLENAGRAQVVVMDKTGTLTEGRPQVMDVHTLDGLAPDQVLALAAAAEARSEHPFARAIVGYAEERGVSSPAAHDTTAAPGRGVRAQVGADTIYAGNPRWFAEMGAADSGVTATVERIRAAGRTAVLVGRTSGTSAKPPVVLGALAIADGVRPGAAAALAELHRAGIRRVVMLTGDNEQTARAVAAQLGAGPGGGINELRADLLPQDKVDAVREIQRKEGTVLFVGDGVNDAPALAAADVGIAMGAAGTDIALETADIALMDDDLGKLAATIRIARKSERIIRANIAFSLLSKAVFVVLAVLGVATLWMAVAADVGASLLVTANGLRALRE